MTQAAQLASIGSGSFAPSFKNRIINGAMQIAQYGVGPTNVASSGYFCVDRFKATGSGSKYSVAQSSTAPSGFTNSLLIQSQSAYSIGSSDVFIVTQKIEGYNISDLGFGGVNAQSVTLSFWVQSSLTGTFGGTLCNSAENYVYPFTYTISSANTWTKITITVSGATAGTWLATNGVGLQVSWQIGVGSTYTASANSWQSGNYYGATGCVSLLGTNAATLYITGVQLEKGTTATSFDYRPYGTELALCQRYCNVSSIYVLPPASGYTQYSYPVSMRSNPSITGGGSGFGVAAQSSAVALLNQTSGAFQTLVFSSEL